MKPHSASYLRKGDSGGHPENFLKIYAIFKIKFIVISYLVELFIFECFVQTEHIPGLFLSVFYRSDHIPGLNCRVWNAVTVLCGQLDCDHGHL